MYIVHSFFQPDSRRNAPYFRKKTIRLRSRRVFQNGGIPIREHKQAQQYVAKTHPGNDRPMNKTPEYADYLTKKYTRSDETA